MSSRSRSKLGLRHFKISSIVKEVSGESGVCGEFSGGRRAARAARVEGGEGGEKKGGGSGGVGGVVGEGLELLLLGTPPMRFVGGVRHTSLLRANASALHERFTMQCSCSACSKRN